MSAAEKIERRDVYSVGDICAICKVSSHTVCRWFDSGRIRGYRVPGTNDRRVPHDFLMTFIRDHGMYVPPELDG